MPRFPRQPLGRFRQLIQDVESEWAENRILSGLSSGEGLVWNVRDPIMAREKVREKGRVTAVREYEADPGIGDKRLLVVEPEYASVLRQIERQGNTLAAVLRQAWETGNLQTLTKNTPAKATGAHISIIGHVTAEELRRYIDVLGSAITFATTVTETRRDERARKVWHQVYPSLSEGKPGLAGALLARGEAQVMRLACIYALLDQSQLIRAEHLLAALALWEYCERLVRFIFGNSLGDDIADATLAALRQNKDGLTKSQIRELHGNHVPAGRLARALALLVRFGLAESKTEETGGRPAERWFAVDGAARKGR